MLMMMTTMLMILERISKALLVCRCPEEIVSLRVRTLQRHLVDVVVVVVVVAAQSPC